MKYFYIKKLINKVSLLGKTFLRSNKINFHKKSSYFAIRSQSIGINYHSFNLHIFISNRFSAFTKNMSSSGIRISWDLKLEPEEITKKADELIERIRKVYDQVGAIKEEDVNFENVLKSLADVECEYTSERYQLDFPQQVLENKLARDASTEADKKLQDFDVEISMRQDVFNNLLALQRKKPTLEPEYQRYLDRLIKLGKRNGLHLSQEVQAEIKALKSQMNELSIQFHKNLNEENTRLEFEEAELEGLPEEFISSLKVDDHGKRIVTLKYPHYFPIMRKAKNPATRKRLEHAFDSQCIKENTPLLEKLVTLRQKQAELLGFSSHVAYVTDFRMAKSAENVYNFLTELAAKLKPLWNEEEAYLLELKKKDCEELGLPFDGKLHFYDLRYYTTMVEEIKYSVDQNLLRKYFPLPTLTQKLLEIYQHLLGLKFEEVKEGAKVWHPDVRLFSVKDSKSGQLLGYFFLDLFPREGKYGHAAMFELQPGCLLPNGERQVAVGALVTNFTKSSSEDKPSLLDHTEVTTFFHEFGHVMHHICSQANLAHFNGTNVERDFIEAPSQMLENWCWEAESLRLMSSHYEDGSQIPDTLLEPLIHSRLANTAYHNLRQIILALFDHAIHTRSSADTQALFAEIHEKYLRIAPSPGTNFAAHFGHLACGYDAQYYSYMWSEVFSCDMFYTRFRKDGAIMAPEVGCEYRDKILRPGGSKDAINMLVDFLGREPNQEAFLITKGLKPAAA